MNLESHRELKVLEAIAANDRTTQRGLSAHLGIALGLTNLYLKRLARKGYIKCVNIRPNRVRYLITPQGIAQKTRLTYAFMEYSLQVFREGRQHLKTMLAPYAFGPARVVIYGTGDAAELAYLCVKELGLELTVVFDDARDSGGTFFGRPVLDISTQSTLDYDVIIVATMDSTVKAVRRLLDEHVPPEKILTLRDVPPELLPVRRSTGAKTC